MGKIKFILFGLIWLVFIFTKIIGISEISWFSTFVGVPTVYFNGIVYIENVVIEIKELIEKYKSINKEDKMKIDVLEPMSVIEVNEINKTIESDHLNIEISVCNDKIDKLEKALEICSSKEEAELLKYDLIHNQFVRQDLLENAGYSYQKRKIDKRSHF